MTTLSTRIKNLHKRSKNVGRDYLYLFVECVETMDTNWTPMAELLAGANPKDSAVLRRLAGLTLQDWTVKRDSKHRTGLRFTKGPNAGYEQLYAVKLKALADEGHVLQGKKVAEVLEPEGKDVKPVSVEALSKAYVKNAQKKIDDGAISTADALEAMRKAIKALEASIIASASDTRTQDADH